MSNATKAFADHLQELIAGSRKSMKELARDINISSGALSKYQNDGAEAGIDALVKIALRFDVSTDWLLGLSDVSKPDAEIQGICAKTGLTEKVVDLIVSLNEVFIEQDGSKSMELRALNTLLGEWGALRILHQMGHIERMKPDDQQVVSILVSYLYTLSFYTAELDYNTARKMKAGFSSQIYELEKNERYNRFELIDLFTKLIDDIYKPTNWEPYYDMCETGEVFNRLAEAVRAVGKSDFADFIESGNTWSEDAEISNSKK